MKNEDLKTALIIIVVLFVLYRVNKFFSAVGSGIGAPDGSQTGGSEEHQPNMQNLTFPTWKYEQLADIIESSVWGGLAFTENDDAIEEALKECQTDDDFIALSAAYGVRGRGVILRDYYNLVQTLNLYLDNSNRENVNTDFESKGMDVRI
jgi:hypothetical protein